MRYLGFFSLILLLVSCKPLTYVPSQTPEEQDDVRKLSVVQQLDNSFKQIHQQFKLLAYGQTTAVKPDSYRKLDSLFNRKYNLNGQYNAQLEEAIERQQAAIASDTLHVVYETPVWYELKDSSGYDFYLSTVTTNKGNKIEHVKTTDTFSADSLDVPWAEAYMKETDFVTNQSNITTAEDKFFDFYKGRALQLNGDDKDAFMKHIFHLMRLANTNKTLSTELLLQSLAREELNKLMPGTADSSYTIKAEEVSEKTNNNSNFDYYQVTATFTDGRQFIFRYDQYLQELAGGQ